MALLFSFQHLSWLALMGILLISGSCKGNPDAKRLYDDLLSNYNKLVRPVVNVTDAVTVRLKLKLSQLIDVNLRNQIMTTNLWVEQFWYDYKMRWNPEEYGGVDMLHVPSDHIWRPDIVLYNNADGNFEVTLSTKATLFNTGRVEWRPPAIYHSSCEMDVEYFPFDEQTCVMKFGSWTYDGFQVDLRHQEEEHGSNIVSIGVDLTEFYMSVEWDILAVPAIRNVKFYTCCEEPYLDITFNITMRRKTLFYTVNLIIPCMGISFLTVLVFYLPSDSGEKVSLSISILLSLTVFFLLLAEIIPPTSLVVPLLGKFVLFTMILDTFSICVTVVVLNVHFRSPQTHTMAPWMRRVFIHILPRLLVMQRPGNGQDEIDMSGASLTMLPPSQQQQQHHHQQQQQQHAHPPNDTVSSSASAVPSSKKKKKSSSSGKPRPPYPRGVPGEHGGGSGVPTRHVNHAQTLDNGLNHAILDFDDEEDEDIPPALFPPAVSRHRLNSLHLHAHPGMGALEFNQAGYPNPNEDDDGDEDEDEDDLFPFGLPCQIHSGTSLGPGCPEIYRALDGVRYIAECTKREEDSSKVKEDWKYVAMVLDRLFLWIFTVAVLVGSAGIILQAPALYDTRGAIDVELSEIEAATAKPRSDRKNTF